MEHFAIIGNGVAGIQAAFEIRRRHGADRAKITVISDETKYFFSRTALMYAYMNQLQRPDLEPHERNIYDKRDIELIHDRVVDLNAESQVLECRDGQSIEYDKLLLAVGANPRMIPFEGLDSTGEGVVNFVSMQDLDECERLTWSTDEAVVVGGGLIGVELVECLDFHGVDVTFLVREPFFWPVGLHEREGDIITEHIRSHGIDIRHEEELAEIIPASEGGRVEAVESSTGERYPCQMLGIAIGVAPNIEWLDGVKTPPETDRGIFVDRSFETSLDNVWAAGDCTEIQMGDGERRLETIWYSAKREGRLAGMSMLGDEVDYEPPTFYNSAKFMDIEYTTVGQVTNAEPGTRTLYRKMPDEPISQRLVLDDSDRVVGFNMLGSRWDHTTLIEWVEQGRRLDWVLDHLEEAQFDVEFGQTDLSAMKEEEIVL